MQASLSHFPLPTPVTEIKPLSQGHINDSYKISTESGQSYLLQRINHEVFRDVPGMMNNIHLVTSHLRAKMETGTLGSQQTLTIVPTEDDNLYHRDEAGNYWRVYDFLSDLRAFDVLETPEQAYEGARAFGYFLRGLDDFPHERAVAVIPDFHNVVTRLSALRRAVASDANKRLREVKSSVDYAFSLADRMSEVQQLWDAGKLRTRITHNDTKFNNVMFDAAGRGRCVVDLDTVMPGVVHFDFGDGVRTGAATAGEDEADLQLVGVDLDKFRGFAAGYLELTRDRLSATERAYLPLAGPLLAYLMGVRFLTDYLEGDRYYKTSYPAHNLVRARNQLRLVRELLGRETDFRSFL